MAVALGQQGMVAVSIDGILLESDDIDTRPLSPIKSATALVPVRQVSAESHHPRGTGRRRWARPASPQ